MAKKRRNIIGEIGFPGILTCIMALGDKTYALGEDMETHWDGTAQIGWWGIAKFNKEATHKVWIRLAQPPIRSPVVFLIFGDEIQVCNTQKEWFRYDAPEDIWIQIEIPELIRKMMD